VFVSSHSMVLSLREPSFGARNLLFKSSFFVAALLGMPTNWDRLSGLE